MTVIAVAGHRYQRAAGRTMWTCELCGDRRAPNDPEPPPCLAGEIDLPATPPASRLWMKFAACRGLNPDLFHSGGRDEDGQGMNDTARLVCAGCEVRDDCLEHALVHNERLGVWGGTTPKERRRLRRSRQRQEEKTLCPT